MGARTSVTAVITYMGTGHAGPSKELDAASIDACRAGDPAALRAFVLRYQRTVFAFVSRTLGAGLHVEDVAQEVFVRALRALPRFDPSGAARPSMWLLTIAMRLVVSERRKRRVALQPLTEGDDVPEAGTPETERRRVELGRALQRAAAQLSDEHRDVFVLAELHDLEMREIGQVLGIPEGTAKTRLFRARERLRELLHDVWEDA
jgi:RNA polymerase sigma-70 factor (ECF subfamily)